MTNGQVASTRGGSWTKVAIFISLYVLLLESVIEWALVLYLYGNGRVDRKMTPSLILALVAVSESPKENHGVVLTIISSLSSQCRLSFFIAFSHGSITKSPALEARRQCCVPLALISCE